MSSGGQILGGGVRKAYASKGDDTTLSRFVKTEHAHKPRKLQPKLPGIGAPAFVQEGRTKFPSTVRRPEYLERLLVTGHSNVKIGRDVRKGKHRGYWIFTLSLEERKTCPSSCAHWQTCYGNNMPFAKRVDHTAPEFLDKLEADICRQLAVRGRTGILIRLHALGDFYSVGYCTFWWRMLKTFPNLAVFGYTARSPFSEIGREIASLNRIFGDRCRIRFSNNPQLATMSTRTIATPESRPANTFVCPEQTGKTQCCATCGACWSTTKNVAFLEH